MNEFSINKDKYDRKSIKIIKDVFYRPEHPLLKDRQSGWVAQWQLVYKQMFTTKRLYLQEEVYNSEEEAQNALKKYTTAQLLDNIKEFLVDE